MSLPSDLLTLLEPLRRSPQTSGIFLDFDGTLSHIVEDPDTATPVPGVVPAMNRLSKKFAAVAVVSGRPLSFLSSRLPVDESVRMRGMYGMQQRNADGIVEDERAAKWRSVVDEGATTAEAQLPKEITVERKGLGFVLHYRAAPELGTAAEEWAARFSAQSGLDAQPARCAVEVGPSVDVDKGSIVRELSSGLSAICVIGDDRSDIPMFEAAHTHQETLGAQAIGIAVRSSEMPALLGELADGCVDGPDVVVELLELLGS